MDEMRNRYRMPRGDYAAPVRRPMAPSPPPPAPHQAAPTPVSHAPQPQPQHSQHQPSPHQAAARPHRRSKKRRVFKFFIFLLILAALAGGGFLAYHKYYVKNPFPADIRQNAGLDLLYPTKLPAGYTVDPTSIQQTNGILLYDATSGSNRLVFTLQKTPPTFDFATFYKQQLQDNQQFFTAYGQAAVGKNSNRYLGSLVDGDTWLLLSTNTSSLGASDFTQVLNSLKKY